MLTRLFLFPVLATLLASCSIANLQTDVLADNQVANAESKGRELLQITYEKMGYDALQDVEVYEVTSKFTWSPVWSSMPMNSLPGAKGNDIQFRFAANTFDGQVEFLEGRKQGQIMGIQSWEGYQRDDASAAVESLGSKRYPWGLATYHYLAEAPMRLLGADIIRYAGEREFDGQHYDLVFVTWGDGTQKKEYDQWLLYINKATGFTDLTELTITDFFLPMPGGMKNATVRFPERVKTSIGAHLPATTVIQLGHPKEDIEKDVYTFTFRDFKFDTFEKAVLYPLDGLPVYGDSKPRE
ncbi:hypothetical protein [Lewinella sp. 4G2]|uniref:hypothetical protein n=1 Tax=Lewinella sp. 4G2 TaxID=1803372 RepID=UPI0007B4A95A|nr:hypothetical protein [Lewinella sp. 4G2]OAV45183.1 hypothetical protein A3850_012070 [Lewinella sp. 4G2]